jgi:Phage tail sheath protein FI
MVTACKTPGVYIEEISKLPSSVAQVETAIPAFIGYTEKATRLDGNDLIFVPTRIKSLQDYETFFGTVNSNDIKINVQVSSDINGNISSVSPILDSSSVITKMYYALQMYFANGGGPCYVVSVGVSTQIPSPLSINGIDRTGTASISLDFRTAIGLVGYEDEVTLFAFPDMHRLDDDDYYSVYDEVLIQCDKLGDRFTIVDVRMDPDSTSNTLNTDDPFTLLRSSSINSLKYGAAYYPDLKTILNYIYDESNVAVFDSNGSNTLKSLESSNTLLYNNVITEIRNQLKVELAPSSIMAGIYARVDSDRGVWKSPANESISGVIEPLVEITDEDQKSLNVDPTSGKSINAIRTFTGKGILVWGARTLAGNDNEWRYVSVRRFYNMVEESVKKASSWVVFEPNDATSWTKVKSMIDNYLITLWRQGALAGSSPEKAFFVKVGLGETMTSLDILEGRMNIEIGMAVVRPAEFIILKFSHKLQEA